MKKDNQSKRTHGNLAGEPEGFHCSPSAASCAADDPDAGIQAVVDHGYSRWDFSFGDCFETSGTVIVPVFKFKPLYEFVGFRLSSR